MNNSRWNILYRGPLSSCNYACGYCPFAKRRNTAEELADDATRLGRFVGWVERQAPREIGVLFTPWGEALIRPAYRHALLELGAMPHVRRAAIQTNLSCPLEWLEAAPRDTLALWCTFHPSETSVERFAGKIRVLDALGIRHSVGAVGVKEHLPVIGRLREELPASTYLWINAFRQQRRYYDRAELEFLNDIDPHFPLNLRPHPSRGRACHAGHTSVTVDGDGVVRRCHFIDEPVGHIDDPGFAARLEPRSCSNATCHCHIGYVNLEHLRLDRVFGDGLLERIPDAWG